MGFCTFIENNIEGELLMQPLSKKENTQFKRSFNVPVKAIGCGQGGSNLISDGNDMGIFEEVAAINTTTADNMGVPEVNRILCLNQDNPRRGAGKNAIKGYQLFKENARVVRERLGMIFSEGSVDAFYLVAASLGGGSGNGIAPLLAGLLRSAMDEDQPQPLIGLMTLPEDSFLEPRAARNVILGLDEIKRNQVFDSLCLIDNNKFYNRVKDGESLSKVNKRIWKPWAHVLSYVGRQSDATMDIEDFESLIKMGRCVGIYETIVATTIESADEIRECVLKSWKDENHFYPDELSNPHRLLNDNYSHGFCLLIGAPANIIDRKRALFEGLYSGLMSILPNNPTSYKGFVPDDTLHDHYRVITIFTGLPYPLERIQEIAEMVNQSKMVADDTPSFIQGIDRDALIGTTPNRRPENSESLFSTISEEVNAKKESSAFSLSALEETAKPKIRKGPNFGQF